MNDNPCCGCKDRVPGSLDGPSCHATCKRHKAWKEAHKIPKDPRREADDVLANGVLKARKIAHRTRRK